MNTLAIIAHRAASMLGRFCVLSFEAVIVCLAFLVLIVWGAASLVGVGLYSIWAAARFR